jgi:hypothetical protein
MDEEWAENGVSDRKEKSKHYTVPHLSVERREG